MKSVESIEAVLEELRPGTTVKDLAQNMCDPFWQTSNFELGGEMMIQLDEMKEVAAQALSEIQHKLIDEFVESMDSPDELHRREVLELMNQFIPPETKRDILAIVLKQGLGLESGKGRDTTPGLGRGI